MILKYYSILIIFTNDKNNLPEMQLKNIIIILLAINNNNNDINQHAINHIK